MNVVDAVLAIVILLGALVGARRGFIVATLQLLVLASSLVLAFFAYREVAAWLDRQLPALGLWGVPLGFVGTFIVAHLLLGAVANAIIRAFPRPVHAAGANRVLGVLPGVASGSINATVLALIVLTFPLAGERPPAGHRPRRTGPQAVQVPPAIPRGAREHQVRAHDGFRPRVAGHAREAGGAHGLARAAAREGACHRSSGPARSSSSTSTRTVS